MHPAWVSNGLASRAAPGIYAIECLCDLNICALLVAMYVNLTAHAAQSTQNSPKRFPILYKVICMAYPYSIFYIYTICVVYRQNAFTQTLILVHRKRSTSTTNQKELVYVWEPHVGQRIVFREEEGYITIRKGANCRAEENAFLCVSKSIRVCVWKCCLCPLMINAVID